jgi:polyisoprenoid-binding protein YceI
MTMRNLLALPLLLLAVGASTPTYHYHLDSAHSTVSAKVAFMGLASKTARFPKMSGSITLQPDRLDAIDLDVELDATALTAGDSVTQARLKGKDFFDVEHYPSVHFSGRKMTMTGPVTATVEGEVTARGVTRPAVLQVAFTEPPAKATGRDPVRLSARTTINRYDFGMKAYGMIVGKKVTIAINAQMAPG